MFSFAALLPFLFPFLLPHTGGRQPVRQGETRHAVEGVGGSEDPWRDAVGRTGWVPPSNFSQMEAHACMGTKLSNKYMSFLRRCPGRKNRDTYLPASNLHPIMLMNSFRHAFHYDIYDELQLYFATWHAKGT